MLWSTVRAVAWARARRRIAALVTLALLCGLAGAVVLASFAGAHRTSTAVERALDQSNVADVSVDIALADEDTLAEVRALPEVEQLSVYQFVAVRPGGTDLVGGIDLVGVLPLDDVSGIAMDLPRVYAGRMPAPDRTDEVALTPSLAASLGLGVGDPMRVEAYGQDQVGAIFSEGDVDPAGAVIDARVVGIAEPLEALTTEGADEFGVVMLSEAMWRNHGAVDDLVAAEGNDIGAFRMVLRAQLRNGAADEPGFLAGVFDIYGDLADTTFSEARPDVFAAIGDTIRVEAIAIFIFGIAAAIATVGALGQALAREASLELQGDDTSLRALGMHRREVIGAAAGPVVAAVAAGGALAVPAAAVASQWLPLGRAGAIEPDPGMLFQPAVLLPAIAILVILLAARTMTALWWATRPAGRRGVGRKSGLPLRGRIPSASIGMAMALRGRPTLGTAAIAVAGVVAALTFSSSLQNLGATPRLYGEDFDLDVLFQADGSNLVEREAPRLAADERISGLTQYQRFEVSVHDDRATGMGLSQLKGVAGPTVLQGRLPAAGDEIAIDPMALEERQPAIGDRLPIAGGGAPVEMTVVGLLTGAGTGEFVVTSGGAERLTPFVPDEGFFLRVDADAVDAVAAELRERIVEVEASEPPPRVANLRAVDGFPYAVAAFLALLGVGAVAHLLVGSVRRSRHELAIVRALGFTRRQVREVVAWQATTVAAVAATIGLPIGLLAGRLAWSGVADALRVVNAPTAPRGSAVLVPVAALVLVNLLGVVPGRSAVRTRPADALRAD